MKFIYYLLFSWYFVESFTMLAWLIPLLEHPQLDEKAAEKDRDSNRVALKA